MAKSKPGLDGLSPDQKIVQEAKERFQRCVDWESLARTRWIDDLKFANADEYNGYQWPADITADMGDQERVMLTINKVRQHNLQIMNDARQNKPGVSIKPTGSGATYESAQIYEGIVRHIEYISNAQVAYDTATRFQVQAGIGYLRVVTDYAGDDSFDQEIFIRRVNDPQAIYLDPDHKEADGSDARFGFVFDDMPKDEFDRAYPKLKDKAGQSPLGNTSESTDGWFGKDHVRVAEYYRIVEESDTLVYMVDPSSGETKIDRLSSFHEDLHDTVLGMPGTKTRDITVKKVEWYLIAGDQIAERKVGDDAWAGSSVPIIPVLGETTVIDGVLDRKGHTRAMISPQRMYNYWSSQAVEQVALQGKTPYITTVEAIEGLETYWANANVEDPAYLPYNGFNEAGDPIQKPERAQPPVMAVAFMNGMKISSEEIQAASGQYQAEMGMPSNERSGVAIQQRQRQGDNATYHYIDHLGIAIRRVGKILLELIPKIYDTQRVIRIMADDGTEKDVQLDPAAEQAFLEERAREGEAVRSIFNPNVGKYDVQADIGPSYGTRRQEAFNAFQQIIAQNKEAFPLIADLMFKAADFPMADEIAERMKRMVPPQALGTGPSPQEQQLQAELQKMQGLLQTMAQQLGEEKSKVTQKDSLREIEWFRAETDRATATAKIITDRLKVIEDHLPTPKLMMEMVHDLAMQEHAANNQLRQMGVQADLAPPAAPDMADASDGASDLPQGETQEPEMAQ